MIEKLDAIQNALQTLQGVPTLRHNVQILNSIHVVIDEIKAELEGMRNGNE